MNKTVRLIHLGSWYKCFGDDAKIISFITDYKLFEDIRTLQPTVGFPESSIDKVVTYLKQNKINYTLVNDSDRIYDFGNENNYDRFLHDDLPFSYVVNGRQVNKKITGRFIVKYESEEESEEFIINDTISQEAELTKKVLSANIGDIVNINGERVLIIEKEINE